MSAPPTPSDWQERPTPFFADRYRAILHQLPQAFCLVEVLFDAQGTAVDGRLLDSNAAFDQQTPLGNPVGRTLLELAPTYGARWAQQYGAVVRTGQQAHLELPGQPAADGSERWYAGTVLPTGPPGSPQVAVLLTPCPPHRPEQTRQAFLLQLSDALRPLAAAADIQQTAARLLGEHLQVSRTLYGEVHGVGDEAAGIIRAQYVREGAPHPERFVYQTHTQGFADETLRDNVRLIVDDVATDPRLSADMRQHWLDTGIAAVIALPLIKEGEVVCLFGVHHARPRTWSVAEVALMADVAERTWSASERARAEAALRVQEARYRTELADQVHARTAELEQSRDLLQACLDSSLDMIQLFEAIRDADGHLVDFRWQLNNHTAEQLYGEVCGQSLLERNPGVVAAGIFADFQRVIETGEPLQVERHYAQEQFNGWFLQSVVKLGDGVATSTKDITAWKDAQAEVLHLRLTQQQALFEAVQRAQEEERRRIAESLHNGLGQVLFATKLHLDRLPLLPEQPAQQEAARLLSEAIHQTRALSHELTPALLEAFGLEAALRSICRELSTPQLRWHCYLELADATVLPVAMQLAVYRLAQGLAHNVAQHAQASAATLEVEMLPDWLVLRIEDNGQGFDPATVQEGLGLQTLHSRVALLGGTVLLESAPGQGTQIGVRLPVYRDDRK